MNESVLPNLIEALESEGLTAEAANLRAEWHQKVNYFVSGSADLFASEYSFDSTGFESQQAMGRYALENAATLNATNPAAYQQAALKFMDEVNTANTCLRGWLEPAYYHYGSDFRQQAGDWYTLSYMSQLGGWAMLDYAFNYATNPAPLLRLGFGSYLSSWALLNSGTAASSYGYWYPGIGNDGACGGGFEPSPYNNNWLGQPVRRGAWYYGSEQDLSFCGAMCAAATILTDDPIFGRICYGGTRQSSGSTNQVVPLDGVRQRFHALLTGYRLQLELTADRFAAGQPVVVVDDGAKVQFSIETRNPSAHYDSLRIVTSRGGQYTLSNNHGLVTNLTLVAQQPATISLPVDGSAAGQSFVLQAVP
jgi:hypothetical protein